MPVEEPVIPHDVEESANADAPPNVTAQPVEPAPPAAPARPVSAANADEGDARKAALAKLPDTLREAFEGEHDDEELESVTAGLTADTFRKLPAAARAALRATLRAHAEAATTAEATRTADQAALAKERAKLREEAKALREREAALMELVRGPAAQAPGKEPDLDPFTPEGQRALAAYNAKKGVAEALAPLRQRAAEVDRNQRWLAIVEANPELHDPKVAEEFDAYVGSLNEGVDPAKGHKPRVSTQVAAQLFFNERKRAALQKELDDRRSREATDRADAARSISRSTTGGAPSLVDRYRALKRTDPDAALSLLETNPDVRAAVLTQAGIRP